MKSMSQIEYHINELLKEKGVLIKHQIEEKVDEFAKILIDMPAKDEGDLKRVLMMMTRDIKNIVEQ